MTIYHILRVVSQTEEYVAEQIRQSFPCSETYYPRRRIAYRPHHGRMVKDVDVPVYPGYLFAYLEKSQYADCVRQFSQCIGVVAFGGVPALVRQPTIDILKAREQAELWEAPIAYPAELKIADTVEIMAGPFTGIRGSVLSFRNTIALLSTSFGTVNVPLTGIALA